MSAKSALVLATLDRSRVMVLDSASLSKPLVRIDGSWLIGTFSPDELKDDFGRVRSSKERTTLFHEASAALRDNPNLPREEDREQNEMERTLYVEDDDYGFRLSWSDIEGSEDYIILPERVSNYRDDDPKTGEYAKTIRYLQKVAPNILWRYKQDGIDSDGADPSTWRVICVPWDQIDEAQYVFDRYLDGDDLSDYYSQEVENEYADEFLEDDNVGPKATLERAIAIAVENHAGQVDKAGAPYVLHPLRVMHQMDTESEQIVAVLHDVVEDTGTTFDELRQEGFDDEVLEGIDSVTRRDEESYDDFILRAAANPIGYKVKMADLLDNLDMRRIKQATEKDFKRLSKYKDALNTLKSMLP